MDAVISFDDCTCPKCGKGILKSKNIHDTQQYNTIDRFVCTECGLTFPIKWELSGDTYKPCPMYSPSSIETFKKSFY